MNYRIRTLAAAFAVASATTATHAAWLTLDVPPLSQTFGTYWAEHLSDGRFVYASNSDLDRQQTFGAGPVDDFQNAGAWDPSSLAIFSDTLGAIGRGGFGASEIFTFNPTNLATSFAPVPGVSLQNYTLLFRDVAGLYVGGGNGTELNVGSTPKHSVSYVSLDGAINKVIIDNISDYSSDIAVDHLGNLYVSDGAFAGPQLYRFTPAQLTNAITGGPLALGAGTLLGTIGGDSSLAVDDLGRVWSSGFATTGIEVFDPSNGTRTAHTPALGNTNYTVSTFLLGGVSYVAALNAAGTAPGTPVTYSYERASALVPEPATGIFLALGALTLLRRRSPVAPRPAASRGATGPR